MSLIDSHCHLTDDRVWKDARNLIERAIAGGVTKMRVGGLYPEEWVRQLELQKEYPGVVFNSFGLHPWWVERYSRAEMEMHLQKLESQIGRSQAIGETGLDFYEKRDPLRFADQEYAFRFQLRLALKYQKPLVLHIVKAHEQSLQIIKEEKAGDLFMQMHSFSGSEEQAKEWLKLKNAFLSFSGGFIKKNAKRAVQAIKTTPPARLLLETDAPDQAWRDDGQNEPVFIREIYEKAAEVLDLKLASLQAIVAENFKNFE